MRISELARNGGVPVATVKFYLREGLLHAGTPTSATQAEYDESHISRLRLVRALVDVGRLPLASVRAVLDAVDAGTDRGMAAIARAHDVLPPVPVHTCAPERARALVGRLGWWVPEESAGLHRLEAALAAVEAVGLGPSPAVLDVYAQAALLVAASDVATVPRRADGDPDGGPDERDHEGGVGEDSVGEDGVREDIRGKHGRDEEAERERTAERVRHIVVGTILYEPVLLALRRLAQQHLFVTGGH